MPGDGSLVGATAVAVEDERTGVLEGDEVEIGLGD